MSPAPSDVGYSHTPALPSAVEVEVTEYVPHPGERVCVTVEPPASALMAAILIVALGRARIRQVAVFLSAPMVGVVCTNKDEPEVADTLQTSPARATAAPAILAHTSRSSSAPYDRWVVVDANASS